VLQSQTCQSKHLAMMQNIEFRCNEFSTAIFDTNPSELNRWSSSRLTPSEFVLPVKMFFLPLAEECSFSSLVQFAHISRSQMGDGVLPSKHRCLVGLMKIFCILFMLYLLYFNGLFKAQLDTRFFLLLSTINGEADKQEKNRQVLSRYRLLKCFIVGRFFFMPTCYVYVFFFVRKNTSPKGKNASRNSIIVHPSSFYLNVFYDIASQSSHGWICIY